MLASNCQIFLIQHPILDVKIKKEKVFLALDLISKDKT